MSNQGKNLLRKRNGIAKAGYRVLKTGEVCKVVDAKSDMVMQLSDRAATRGKAHKADGCAIARQINISCNQHAEVYRCVAFVRTAPGVATRYSVPAATREIQTINDVGRSKLFAGKKQVAVLKAPSGYHKLANLRGRVRRSRVAKRAKYYRRAGAKRVYVHSPAQTLNLREGA